MVILEIGKHIYFMKTSLKTNRIIYLDLFLREINFNFFFVLNHNVSLGTKPIWMISSWVLSNLSKSINVWIKGNWF